MSTPPPRGVAQPAAENDTARDGQGHRRLVREVFRTAAPRYDLMNDLMSFGLHRPIKRLMMEMATILPHHRVLDIAAGTCDLTLLARRKAHRGQTVALDSSLEMLRAGRDRLIDQGIGDVPMVCAEAEHLPFAADSFDRVLTGFGLRNFSDMEAAMAEVLRVLRPGGRWAILELSKPDSYRVRRIYDEISVRWLPQLGRLVAGDSAPWQYLHDSIRRHPPSAEVLSRLEHQGFVRCERWRLLGGTFCLFWGEKD